MLDARRVFAWGGAIAHWRDLHLHGGFDPPGADLQHLGSCARRHGDMAVARAVHDDGDLASLPGGHRDHVGCVDGPVAFQVDVRATAVDILGLGLHDEPRTVLREEVGRRRNPTLAHEHSVR